MWLIAAADAAQAAPAEGLVPLAGTPLLVAFQKFCVDTRADPQAVAAAALAAGIEKVEPGAEAAEAMGIHVWRIPVGDRELDLSSVSLDGSKPQSVVPAVRSISCTVVDHEDDGPSLEAARKQIAMAPSSSTADFSQYTFRWEGERQIPITDGLDFNAAFRAGRLWSLDVGRSNGATSLGLTLTGAVSPTH
jgi:hypothetical protein